MSDKLAVQVCKRHEKLKSDRHNWDDHWQEVADYVIPRKDNVWRTPIRGEKKTNKPLLVDSTGIHANELLGAALHGTLTNPATIWFELTTGDSELDKKDDVRKFLQDSGERMHRVLNNSNFQTEIHEVYLDLGSFGTGLMRIEEDEKHIVRFESRPIYEVYVDENSKGQIDTVHRLFRWDARQIAQEFGEEVLTDELQRMLKADKQQKLDIIHAVFPSEELSDQDKKQLGARGMKYASVYVLKTKNIILKKGGFKEFPYVVPRWTKISGEMYGRSPAMKALPDIKMINTMMRTTVRAAQKVTDPPLQMSDDGVILPLNLNPGGLNYRRPGSEPIIPINTGSRIDFGFQVIDEVRNRIREAFFIDQLQLNEGPQMTATEVQQRTEEKLRLLGPILGRQHFELLRPMIDRIFAIMLRKNMFKDIPEVLSELKLDVQYSSQIAKAQRTQDANNLTRALSTIAPLIEFDPSVMDNIDPDEAFRSVSKIFGVDQDILRDEDEVDAIREQRAEAAQAQAEQEQQLAQAEAIQKAGPTVLKAQEA